MLPQKEKKEEPEGDLNLSSSNSAIQRDNRAKACGEPQPALMGDALQLPEGPGHDTGEQVSSQAPWHFSSASLWPLMSSSIICLAFEPTGYWLDPDSRDWDVLSRSAEGLTVWPWTSQVIIWFFKGLNLRTQRIRNSCKAPASAVLGDRMCDPLQSLCVQRKRDAWSGKMNFLVLSMHTTPVSCHLI